MSRQAKTVTKITSDSIHNQNCFAYLQKLKISKDISATFPHRLRTNLLNTIECTYNPKTPYADIYSAFFTHVEKNISEIRITDGYDEFIDSLYNNDNKVLETTFNAIRHIAQSHLPADSSIEKNIQKAMKDNLRKTNWAQSPSEAGSMLGRVTAMLARNFKPQHTTSLATVRTYEYNKDKTPKEYRFGTQGQRHHGKERVSPLFEAWLDQHPNEQHIYFNNLGWDRKGFEGNREKALTDKLHALENNHPNIAVITLPADKGLMNHHKYKITTDRHNYQDVYNEFFNIASKPNTPKDAKGSNDFYISPSTRERVFGNDADLVLKKLLTNSFNAMGIKENSPLSSAQRQAVWFHFIKFELTNQIISKLNPDTINFSCKDAIDRGGVSSAYYNLIKSFETSTPLNREEFDRGLHAAPAMVKGRGMNAHLNMIWNTVDAYVNTHYQSLKQDETKAWLIEWRDMNCPLARVPELLELRLKQSNDELDPKNPEHTNGIKILDQIKQQSTMSVNGQRLLLEAAVLTPKIILKPNDENLRIHYDKIADKLQINYPGLQVLAGLMKTLVGAFLFSKERIHSGWETMKVGMNAIERKVLQKDMKASLSNLREDAKPEELPRPSKPSKPQSH